MKVKFYDFTYGIHDWFQLKWLFPPIFLCLKGPKLQKSVVSNFHVKKKNKRDCRSGGEIHEYGRNTYENK